ncbi:MAG: PAS domain-containing protein [Bernardetiaceae bacterium]|nr:PAS domain-containing protein [Bernardetiaceae bacterium]
MMPASIFLIEFAAPGTQSLAWLRLAIGLSLLAQLGYSYWRPTDRPFFDGLTFLNMALVGGLAVFSLYINDFQETQRVQSIMLLAITSLVTQRKRAFITYLLLVNVGMLAAAFGCGCGRIPFTYTIVTAVYSLIAYLALANLNLLSEFSAKIFGLAGAQAVPFREFLRIIHPDDRELIKKTLNTRLGTADTSNIYYRVITPNGQPRYINGVSRMVLVDGQPLYYGLVRDITAEKLAEIELKNTQQFFQSVLDNLPLQVTA